MLHHIARSCLNCTSVDCWKHCSDDHCPGTLLLRNSCSLDGECIARNISTVEYNDFSHLLVCRAK